jgi:hypothetical protein
MVLYVDEAGGSWKPYPQSLTVSVKEDGCHPALFPLLAGQAVDFHFDGPAHHLFSYSELGAFDLGEAPPGSVKTVAFGRKAPRGLGEIKIFCRLHPSERATVLVMRNPFWAWLPAEGGAFHLRMPAGSYRLMKWQEGRNVPLKRFRIRPGQSTRLKFSKA